MTKIYCDEQTTVRAHCNGEVVFGNLDCSTAKVTLLTKSGSISGRYAMGMIGDATSGLIFGGRSGNSLYSDFVRYEVSGTTITLTTLAATVRPWSQGIEWLSSLMGRSHLVMVGSPTSGVIVGGREMLTGHEQNTQGVYEYTVSGGNVAVQITRGLASGAPAVWGGVGGFLTYGGLAYDDTGHHSLPWHFRLYTTHMLDPPNPGGATYTYHPPVDSEGSEIPVKHNSVVQNDSSRASMSYVGNSNAGLIFGGMPPTNRAMSFVRSGQSVSASILPRSGVNITPRWGAGMVGDVSAGTIFGGDSINSGGGDLSDFNCYVTSATGIAYTTLSKTGATIDARREMGMVGRIDKFLIFGGIHSTRGAFNDFYLVEVT